MVTKDKKILKKSIKLLTCINLDPDFATDSFKYTPYNNKPE